MTYHFELKFRFILIHIVSRCVFQKKKKRILSQNYGTMIFFDDQEYVILRLAES